MINQDIYSLWADIGMEHFRDKFDIGRVERVVFLR